MSVSLTYIDSVTGKITYVTDAKPLPTTGGGAGGTTVVTGAAADGAAVTGNPVLVAGQDGTNAQSLHTDTAGNLITVGPVADGGAISGNPVQVAGQDGTNIQTLHTDTAGNLLVGGSVADAAASSGNPNPVGGIKLTTLPTYTDGQRTTWNFNAKGMGYVQIGDAAGSLVATLAGGQSGIARSAFNISLPTTSIVQLYNGTTTDQACDIKDFADVATGTGVAAVEEAGALFNNVVGAATTTVKSGAGILHKVIINTPVASATITIYNNTAGSGAKIGTLTLGSVITGDQPVCLVYDLSFSTGLTFVTSGATDLTVIYR